MNLMEYLALGGLERLLLIGAAILITYWGYHLYGKAQIAGLAMIAVAALLLMSVVLTSGRHQQAVSANLIASVPAPTASPATAPTTEPTLSVQQPAVAVSAEPAIDAAEPEITDDIGSQFAQPTLESAATAMESDTSSVAATASAETALSEADTVEPDRIERLVPLASGQELGGRITSVRSENVTLEWSAGDSRRRVISASSTP